jgi:hypothetical protein
VGTGDDARVGRRRGAGDAAVATSPEPLALPENPTGTDLRRLVDLRLRGIRPEPRLRLRRRRARGLEDDRRRCARSGYLKPGIDGADFGTRIAALDPALDPDLVIVQGSINDRREGADGYRAAVDAAWDALARVYPRARIVILAGTPGAGRGGDRPHRPRPARRRGGAGLVVHLTARRRLDHHRELRGRDRHGRRTDHPSTAGHRYLAEHLAAAVASLTR